VRERSLANVATAVAGRLDPPDAGAVVARGVSIDSRRVRPGDLFVALPGERADGHAFVGDALANGAAAVMVRDRPAHAGPCIVVEDPGGALLALAADERGRMRATVVGITGSTGKTCTKDFTEAVLGGPPRVVASRASFNNEIGLPLTLLAATEEAEVVVCEMGSRGPGHIRRLCEVARPSVGVVTNVGVAHMELFGSMEVIQEAKAELVDALPDDGVAVLNADDPVVNGFAQRARGRVLRYGASPDAAVRALDIEVSPTTGAASFDLLTPSGRARVTLRVPGEHMVSDALAAAAVGHALGVEARDAAARLGEARVSGGRMEVLETSDGIRLVHDAYNANPTSVAAALRSVRWMKGRGRFVAVLGPMAELGPIAREEHERIGELLARIGVDLLVTVGPEGELIARGAEREGLEPERVVRCAGADEAVDALRAAVRPGDVVLVKASRAARLERIVHALRHEPAGVGSVEP
jgi:UDP-N-acetylmuramoyl-tripeptide--D-alanyl-D-alanine ligase